MVRTNTVRSGKASSSTKQVDVRITTISTEAEAALVSLIGTHFPCFGGERPESNSNNPIDVWTRDGQLIFAMGVNVADVVRFVLEQAGVKKPSTDSLCL